MGHLLSTFSFKETTYTIQSCIIFPSFMIRYEKLASNSAVDIRYIVPCMLRNTSFGLRSRARDKSEKERNRPTETC